jgi:hypothetical protein
MQMYFPALSSVNNIDRRKSSFLLIFPRGNAFSPERTL